MVTINKYIPKVKIDGRTVLCPLCLMLDAEEPLRYFSSDNEMGDGDWFYIYPTKDTKGHELRYMVVNKVHGHRGEDGYPTPHVRQDGMNLLFEFMLSRKKDFTIMEPTHATIPDHWHLVASSLGESSATDTYQIVCTDRIEIRFKKASK